MELLWLLFYHTVPLFVAIKTSLFSIVTAKAEQRGAMYHAPQAEPMSKQMISW